MLITRIQLKTTEKTKMTHSLTEIKERTDHLRNNHGNTVKEAGQLEPGFLGGGRPAVTAISRQALKGCGCF